MGPAMKEFLLRVVVDHLRVVVCKEPFFYAVYYIRTELFIWVVAQFCLILVMSSRWG